MILMQFGQNRRTGFSFGTWRIRWFDSLRCVTVLRPPSFKLPELVGLLAILVALVAGCGEKVPPSPLPADTGKLTLEVDGHSLAYGAGADQPGVAGSGYSSQVAEALKAREDNDAVIGATLQESGTKSDGWGVVLDDYPRSAEAEDLPERAPTASLLTYGANDVAWFGPDLTMAREAYRTIISRHRATVVHEAGVRSDPTIVGDDSWEEEKRGPAEGSGGSVLASRDGGTISIEIPAGEVLKGGTVDLGFVQKPKTAATYSIEVDGKAAGKLDTHGPNMPLFYSLGYVRRISGLSSGPHEIRITADLVIGSAAFDYWQVEPRHPNPVVLVKQYTLPDYAGFQAGFSHIPTDADFIALNRMTDALAKEFGPDVLTVDTDRAIGRSDRLLARDGIHPNQEGHDAIARAIVDAMESSRAPQTLREALTRRGTGDDCPTDSKAARC